MLRKLVSHARRNVVAYIALGIALGAAGGVAYSSIPDPQGVIHGCVNDTRGALRVIDSPSASCDAGETALDWNQQGQTGPAGPAGAVPTYGRSVAGPVALPDAGHVKTISTLTVPRGSYAIFAKAEGGLTVPSFSCPQGTDVIYCNLLHNERRLASTTFGCTVLAGPESDLGRANLIAGANALSAIDTVSAELLHTFTDAQGNLIRLRCLQYAGGKWPARISNARLIAVNVDRVEPLDLFKAITTKLRHAPKKPKLRPLRQILKP